MTLIKEVEEKIDEKEFYTIIGKNAVISLFLSLFLVGGLYVVVTYILPGTGAAAELISIPSWISMITTVAIFNYVFRDEFPKESTPYDSLNYLRLVWLLKWAVFGVFYSIGMFLGGEVVVIGLMALGVILTVLFLGTEGGFTYLLTWLSVKNKIKALNKKEEQEEAIKNGLGIP